VTNQKLLNATRLYCPFIVSIQWWTIISIWPTFLQI